MNCLVLGGDGFIGSHLVESLIQKGADVSIYGHTKQKDLKNLLYVKDSIKNFTGDFLKGENLEDAVANSDYVFHLIWSGNPALTFNNPNYEINANLVPTVRLLDLCVKHKIKKFFFPSSGGAVYGNIEKVKASEQDIVHPITPYGLTKYYVEKYLEFLKLNNGLDYLVYRISNAYGYKQVFKNSQGLIPLLVQKIQNREEVPLFGNPVRDYIYIKDVSSFISNNFFKKSKFQTYNLGSGIGTDALKLISILEKIIGKKAIIKRYNERPEDVKRIILNIERIKKEFDFKTEKSLTERLREMITI